MTGSESPQLQYDRPLSPNEVRYERFEDGLRVIIGPRTARQLLVSLDLNIYILFSMALASGIFVICSVIFLFFVHDTGEESAQAAGNIIGAGVASAFLVAATLPGYRRRLTRTVLTVSRNDVGIDPPDDRAATIWVPRTRVISLRMVRLRFRPFVPDAQTLQFLLTGAPPIVTLSGYPSAVVKPIVDELTSALARFTQERQNPLP